MSCVWKIRLPQLSFFQGFERVRIHASSLILVTNITYHFCNRQLLHTNMNYESTKTCSVKIILNDIKEYKFMIQTFVSYYEFIFIT